MSAALAYADAGWYVVPLSTGKNGKHPGSLLGKCWPQKSSRDPEQLRAWFGIHRPSTRGIGLHVGRSGAVAFDVDDDSAVPDALRELLTGDVPFQSSRSNQPGRGAYVFALPEGVMPGNGQGGFKGDWGDVRGYNGIIVVEPSGHPKEHDGGRYAWRRTGALPVLPDAAVEMLSKGGERGQAAAHDVVAGFLKEHVTGDGTGRLGAVLRRIEEAAPGTRHAAAVNAACQLAREAAAGAYPAQLAYDNGLSVFCASLNGEAGRDPEGEWDSVWSWGVGQITDERVAEVRERLGQSATTAKDPFGVADDAAPGSTRLPDSFWLARPELTHIRDAAWSRRAAPDPVLHGVLARLAACLKAGLRVDTGVADPVALNYYAALVSAPGKGKSSSAGVARRVLPTPPWLDDDFFDLPPGTGEGYGEAFMGKAGNGETHANGKEVMERQQVRHNAHALIDEGQQFVILLADRKGSTLGATWRAMWMGGPFGNQNASEERRRKIRNHCFGAAVNLQYANAEALLSDDETGLGTPQRLVWVRAAKAGRPPATKWPGALDVDFTNLRHDPAEPVAEHTDIVTVEESLIEHIQNEDDRRSDEEVWINPLDQHEPIHLVKIAGLLAVLCGERVITWEFWRLAETVWATSCAVRAVLLRHKNRTETERAETRTQMRVDTAVRTEIAKAEALESRDVRRVAKLIAKHVRAAGGPGPKSTVRTAIAARDRKHFDDALKLAENHGWVQVDADKLSPGEVLPA
ncbi:bifunctional DNA primase/polymerase [Streptomyces spinosisporus]|uniref:Bifunctional DNA primase/polymerase n=1 Tax=Streptomyces spinosisporus TaxID=2927582 RepID=A0ABS9X817_9ACTN|nr:bifunctional DNA primase/polymerase [Streptomyces spinosisporus]MCI3238215.1 bifunctional DNA primase/polymerase [Streptomyces spinosisporus]